MSAETRNDLKDHKFLKKANGRIGDGSTERHAAQALGGSETKLTGLYVAANALIKGLQSPNKSEMVLQNRLRRRNFQGVSPKLPIPRLARVHPY